MWNQMCGTSGEGCGTRGPDLLLFLDMTEESIISGLNVGAYHLGHDFSSRTTTSTVWYSQECLLLWKVFPGRYS